MKVVHGDMSTWFPGMVSREGHLLPLVNQCMRIILVLILSVLVNTITKTSLDPLADLQPQVRGITVPYPLYPHIPPIATHH